METEKSLLGLNLSLSNTFISPSLGTMFFSEVIGQISRYVESKPGYTYRVIVGSDSEPHNGDSVEYVSAIAIHRVGAGGIYFWQKIVGGVCFTLKERIYNEALLSLELANRVVAGFAAQDILGLNLEIHVDVGTKGETREIINEIVGMIRGNGFMVKTKPDSFGASKIADRYT